MSILNYTTKIEPNKSAAEIQELLGKKGVNHVSIQYVSGEPAAIFFSIDINKSPVNFRLPSNWEGVLSVLRKNPGKKRITIDSNQAKRVAWRIIKDWVEAQLAIIESGQADIGEVFMPYAINANGMTLWNQLNTNPQLLLGA